MIHQRLLFYRFNIVYLIMLIQGVGTLLPWNMFITAHAVSILEIFIFALTRLYLLIEPCYTVGRNISNTRKCVSSLII